MDSVAWAELLCHILLVENESDRNMHCFPCMANLKYVSAQAPCSYWCWHKDRGLSRNHCEPPCRREARSRVMSSRTILDW